MHCCERVRQFRNGGTDLKQVDAEIAAINFGADKGDTSRFVEKHGICDTS